MKTAGTALGPIIVPGPTRSETPYRHSRTQVQPLDKSWIQGVALSKNWWALSILSMAIAGFYALALVLARMPGLSTLITDPLFFKRCLVVHVNLALGLWLLAFLAGMSEWTHRGSKGQSSRRLGLFSASLGLACIMAAAFIPGVNPVLSNYIPVLDHPLFFGGLFLVAVGLFGALSRKSWSRETWKANPLSPFAPLAAARPLLAVAGIAFGFSLITLAIAFLVVNRSLASQPYYEFLFWGPGHLLQVTHSAGMIAAWILITGELLKKSPVSFKVSRALAIILIAPWLISPFFSWQGPASIWFLSGFTQLMRYAIFPVTLVFMVMCLRSLLVLRSDSQPPMTFARKALLSGLLSSFALTATGFILGAMIRGSNTMVPAHYHAAVGGVTVAYMTAAFLLAQKFDFRKVSRRAGKLLSRQPLIYGVGQLAFALGFAFAGYHGAARKSYGQEQQINSFSESFGLAVMGGGGLLAIVGGLAFMVLCYRLYKNRTDANPNLEDIWKV